MTGRRNWTDFLGASADARTDRDPAAPAPSGRRAKWIAGAVAVALVALGVGAAVAPWDAWLEQAEDAAGAGGKPALTPPPPGVARAPAEVPIFRRTEFQREAREVSESFRLGRPAEGEAALRRLIARWPRMEALRLALAEILARRGEYDAAEAQLAAAAEAGYRDAQAVTRSPLFAPMQDRPGFQAALAAMDEPAPPPADPPKPAIPSAIADGDAVISEANAEWSTRDGVVRAWFTAPEADGSPRLAMSGDSPEARLLNRLVAGGAAAGNRGDFYENRDDDHSLLRRGLFPELTYLEHEPAVRAQGFGRGLADGIVVASGEELYPPLFGNASTAVAGGPYWRSMARLGLTSTGGPQELWREYASNQIYIYPEHKDHDGFYGDVFHANTPYMIVSQGSSGSDQTALRGVAAILAALKPETKAALVRERLVAPTVQMIWRRGQAGIESDEAYLSPLAHPTVFDPETAEPERMIEIANALEPAQIPPMVRLKVLEESRPTPGITLFGEGLAQPWFDTPSAISRLFRGTERTMTMRVGAAETQARDDRPVSFRWVLLRGDPAKVRIRPGGARGEQAVIEVDWHEGVEAPPRGLRSHRVDVAVFAQVEGAALSAPAFLSIAFPPREERLYRDDGQVEMINYDASVRQAEYADPWLWPERGWRDLYRYESDGRPAGWTRTAEDAFERYTRHGARVIESDLRERPLRAEVMAYPLIPEREVRVVHRVPAGPRLVYEYDGPQDRVGYATPEPAPAPAAAPAPAPSAPAPAPAPDKTQ
ncbi:hypothetical protein P2H44_04930 [Albimonas sp. CAU 1670]|uniref:tetratricopeptide repeat protein n=1 Tax=Albimonas sp. CAU 1670 TaxID=3032599 RepID=UPI0023DAD3B4|nr:tetratricopeptide repeat protein [Albimonas sp. CAU 1670]MDF2231890.1 hypothetical protein [Albimonas sp. CAU 1670]